MGVETVGPGTGNTLNRAAQWAASSLFPLIKAASCGRKPPPKALDVLVSNSYGPAYHIGWLVQWDRLSDELFVHILI